MANHEIVEPNATLNSEVLVLKLLSVAAVLPLKTLGSGCNSGLTCLRRFSHPHAIWCFLLRLSDKFAPKFSRKKATSSIIPDWSFLPSNLNSSMLSCSSCPCGYVSIVGNKVECCAILLWRRDHVCWPQFATVCHPATVVAIE